MDKNTPLVVLGDFAWDVLIRTNSPLQTGGDTFGEVMLAPGGSAANVAVWAARCGLETRFVGKIGRDRFGQLAIDNLSAEGVEACLVQTDEHRTAAVAVWIDERGERSMVSGQGADFYLLPSELPREILSAAQHLHLTAWSFFTNPPRAAAQAAAKLAKAAGATLSLDPASFQLIGEMGVERFLSETQSLGIDLFFPNYQEGQVLTGRAEPEAIARKLAEHYPTATIVLKLDEQGAFIYHQGDLFPVPPAPGTLIDATGAGDSFAGAYLAKFLRGKSPLEAARFAVRVSSWVIERIGARPLGDEALRKVLET